MVDRDLFPKSVDVNPTSRRNLDCPMCWGPLHDIPDGLTTGEWKDATSFFVENGTDAIVYTGGDPLMRRDILELIKFSKDLGLRVTLSTNTILLPHYQNKILPLIDELGVPVDGSTSQRNLEIRPGRVNSFEYQLKALRDAKKINPNLDVTVRTVISRRSLDDILNIGNLLRNYGGLFDRWKLYQFSPFNYGSTNRGIYEVSDQEFIETVENTAIGFPDIQIDVQPRSQANGRYLFVGSQGDIYGVVNDRYVPVGNFLTHLPRFLVERITQVVDPQKNREHAHVKE